MVTLARIVVVILLLASAADIAAARTWTSVSGGSRVDAELTDYANGRVVLRKATGANVTVEIDKLCDADRLYAESWLRKRAPPLTGRLAWESDLQGVAHSAPIVARGIGVMAVTQGKTEGKLRDFRVVAIDVGTGKVLWQYPLSNARPGSLHFAGDRVVFGTSLVDEFASPKPEPPTLVCLNLADGSLRWKKSFSAKRDANTGQDYTDVTHIAVGAGRLATLAEGIVVLDFDGNELWRHASHRFSQVGGDAEWLIVTMDTGVADSAKAGIAAFRWEGSDVVWRKELKTGLIGMSRPVMDNDQVLIGATSSANTLLARLVGGMPYLYCLDRATGEERWKAALRWSEYGGGIVGEPTAVGERIFLVDAAGSLLLERATGKSVKASWAIESSVGVIFEPLNFTTVFDGEGGRDALSGQVQWKLPAAEGRTPLGISWARTQCAWISGRLYVADIDGWLRCFE